jgi:hypothetical protein
MSSECGHHQNPRKILQAINDTLDKGNSYGFDREIFEKGESNQPRQIIDYLKILDQSRHIKIVWFGYFRVICNFLCNIKIKYCY